MGRRRGRGRAGRAGRRPVRRAGGKATALAATGATVVAADVRKARVGLVRANAAATCRVLAGRRRRARRSRRRRSTGCSSTPPAPASARCAAGPTPAGASTPTRPSASRAVQRALVDAAVPLVRPGGTARLLGLHPDRRRDDRRRRAPRRRAPRPRRRRPARARRGAARPRRRLLPAGRRHRRHVPPPPPDLTTLCPLQRPHERCGADADPGSWGQTAAMELRAKVITVSDGVVDGTREDRSGAGAGRRTSPRPASRSSTAP